MHLNPPKSSSPQSVTKTLGDESKTHWPILQAAPFHTARVSTKCFGINKSPVVQTTIRTTRHKYKHQSTRRSDLALWRYQFGLIHSRRKGFAYGLRFCITWSEDSNASGASTDDPSLSENVQFAQNTAVSRAMSDLSESYIKARDRACSSKMDPWMIYTQSRDVGQRHKSALNPIG